MPSEVEGSRCADNVVTSRDSSTPLRFARNLLRVIPRLKPFCLFTHLVPDEHNRHSAPYCQVSAGEMNDGNHSVSRIAQTKIRNTVAHGARLFAISTRGQHEDSHVSIGCGKFVSVDRSVEYK